MNLELLPDEIFLDIFDYFDGIDLLRAFNNLNYRFNFLLYKLFRSYCFKFRSMSKRNFDMICQQHLPFISDKIITLHLSNGSETPEQINLLYSYISSFNQFTQLRSLELFTRGSYEGLLKLLDECRHLNNLTHLIFYYYSFVDDRIDLQSTVNSIWSLPKLTNCYFTIIIKERQRFCMPTVISSSLECITLFNDKFEMNQINQLLEYTPRLKYLSECCLTPINDNYIPSPLPTLIHLKIRFYHDDVSKLIIFLQNIPNVRHLDIHIFTKLLIDGHQWEKIISNYLPKLKTFRLKLITRLFDEPNLEERIDELMNSFRSSFWIEEHQWFFRCSTYHGLIHLYTLSTPLDFNFESIAEKCKLTCSQEDYQQVFNNTTFIYDRKFFNRPIPSHIRFPNIEYLNIKFPIHDKFWSIFPSLNRLRSLDVSSYADNYQVQLQTLLDRTSNLHTLTIDQDGSLPLQLSLFKCTNASLHRLHLGYYNHCFNYEECIILSRSSLTVQCEALSIKLNNPKSIINLINNIIKLRSLYIYWNNKKTFKQLSQTTDNDTSYEEHSLNTDELIQWLKVRLPATCLIVKIPKHANHVQIWI